MNIRDYLTPEELKKAVELLDAFWSDWIPMDFTPKYPKKPKMPRHKRRKAKP